MDRSKQRLNVMKRRCARMKVPFTRLAAVDGTKTTGHSYCRVRNAGERGCLLSHVKAARRLLSIRRPYCIILEDDATIKRELPTTVKAARKLFGRRGLRPGQVDILYLQGMQQDRSGRVTGGYGTYGYLLTRAGAHKLVSACTGAIAPVDWVIKGHTPTDPRGKQYWGPRKNIRFRAFCAWKKGEQSYIGHGPPNGSTIRGR